MVTKLFALIIPLFLLLSADKCSRDKYAVDPSGFTYTGQYGHNDEFFINGVYYNKTEKSNYVSYLYFYQDGFFSRNSIEYELFFIDTTPCAWNVTPEIPWTWGKYMVENNIIKIHRVNPHASWPGKFEVDEMWAEIINDSTLHFFKYISRAKKEQPMDITYHFRRCTNKPDSTNVLMKYFE